MMPTSLSQIIEQIFVAVTALFMSGFMIRHFAGEPEEVVRKWSAAGATMGTGAGVAVALLFMLFVYGMNRKNIQYRIKNDRHRRTASYQSLMKNIILIIMPIIFSAFIYNVNGYINSYMYTGILGSRGYEEDLLQSMYAEYGYFMTLINIPLTLASTAPTSMIPEVSAHYAQRDIRSANRKIEKATWVSMLISIPAAVGLAVLSGPVTRLIFHTTNGVAAQLLILGAITIILNGNSNISNGVLQGIGKPNLPMIHASVALVVDVIVMAVLLLVTDLGIYTVVIAMIVYAVVMCLLNDRSMKKYMKYRNPWKKAYLYPLLASIPMALTAGGIYYGLYLLIPSNLICLGVSVVFAVFVYFVVYMALSKPREEDLAGLPGGRLLCRLGRKLHLI